jgi:hypothetical protein
MKTVLFTFIAGTALLLLGCGKAAVQAGRLAPVARSVWARRAQQAGKALDWADKARNAYDLYRQATAAPPPAPMPTRPRFPYFERVRPIANQLLVVNPQAGIYALPHNCQGFIFYDSSGMAIGFSVFNPGRGTYDYFDAFGYLVQGY